MRHVITATAADIDEHTRSLQRALAQSQADTQAEQAKVAALTRLNDMLFNKLREQESEHLHIQHMAYFDALTGLPNRHLLDDRFHAAAAYADRHGSQIALLFLDLDQFKPINDHFGHAHGDHLLKIVAERLLGCLRAIDTVCRFGGDEFVVLSPDLDGAAGAARVAQKVREVLAMPYRIGQRVGYALKVSIGMAVYPIDGQTMPQLLSVADAAMYSDKANHPIILPLGAVTSFPKLSSNATAEPPFKPTVKE